MRYLFLALITIFAMPFESAYSAEVKTGSKLFCQGKGWCLYGFTLDNSNNDLFWGKSGCAFYSDNGGGKATVSKIDQDQDGNTIFTLDSGEWLKFYVGGKLAYYGGEREAVKLDCISE